MVTPSAKRNSCRVAKRVGDDTQGRGAAHLNPGLGNRNSYRVASVNPAKRNVLDLKNETCKNREKRNVLKKSHTRHFKAIKKQSRTGLLL